MRAVAVALLLLLACPAWAGKAAVDWKEVNVRAGPGPQGRLKEKLPAGTEAETLEEKGSWVRIRYAGGEGWVAKKSLRMSPDAAPRKAAKEDPPRKDASAAHELDSPPAQSPPAVQPAVQESPAPAAQPSAASPAPAQGGGYLAAYDKEAAPARVDAGPGLFTVVSALLLVLALVAGAVYLVKFISGRRYLGAHKGRGIQVLATRPLGPRQALVLVEVGGLPLLLAQAESGIRLIAEIQDPEALRRLNDLYGFRETPFEAELHRRLDLESVEAEPKASEPSPEAFDERGGRAGPDPSPEERLEALRRRRKPGEGP